MVYGQFIIKTDTLGSSASDPSASFQLIATGQGLLPTRIPDSALQAMKPSEGLMVYDSTRNCLALFNSSWTCSGQASSSGRFIFPVLSTDSIKALRKPPGTAIYDKDKKTLVVFNGKRWQSTKARGGPWLSEEAFPLAGIVGDQGYVLSSDAPSGTVFTTQKIDTGTYKVTLKGLKGAEIQSVTANVVTVNGPMPSRSSLGGPFSLYVIRIKGGFIYRVTDEDGRLVDKAVSFIAMLKGDRLPAYAKRSYVLADIIDADGTIRRVGNDSPYDHGYSVEKIETGHYKLTFESDTAGSVRALTVIALNRSSAYTGKVFPHVLGSIFGLHSIEYYTSGDTPIALTAVITYPPGEAPSRIDNRYAIAGSVYADGDISSGDQFTVEAQPDATYKVTFKKGLVKQLIAVKANLTGFSKAQRSTLVIDQLQANGFTYHTYRVVTVNGNRKVSREPMAVSFTAIVR